MPKNTKLISQSKIKLMIVDRVTNIYISKSNEYNYIRKKFS